VGGYPLRGGEATEETQLQFSIARGSSLARARRKLRSGGARARRRAS
jgi:hypothetical protein